MYLIVLLPNYERTYDQIDLIGKKLELFIANWSYSYDLKIVFATYQRMRANSTSWAGTRHITSWKYQQQKTVVQSSTKAGYSLLSGVAKEHKFTQILLQEIADVETSGYIYGDN